MQITDSVALVIAAAVACAGCAEKHLAAPDGGGGGGGDLAASCYAAGLGEPPITCPEGCQDIRGLVAEGCAPNPQGEQSMVVGCDPDGSSGLWIDQCWFRKRDGGADLVVDVFESTPEMGMQGYEPCPDSILQCPSAL